MFARSSFFILAIATLSLAGCGPAKLDVTKNYTLDDPKIVILDAQPKVQNIKVDFEADNPVIVLLVKDADLPKDDEGGWTAPNKAMASKPEGKSGTLTVEVPANTATRVVVRSSSGKATVKLHITN